MTLDNSIAETNARSAARGALARWLIRRYGAVELVELADEPDPINLRQIYIPLKLAAQPIEESATDEATQGEDAWDIVVREKFLAISGLPGSGKTTLVKSLITELCGTHDSPLRMNLRGQRGIAVVPFILRELGDLSSVNSLDDLFGQWWAVLDRQMAVRSDESSSGTKRREDLIQLDLPRLKDSFSPDGENFPILFLFDGIDEVGGAEVRTKVLAIATEAIRRGQRVVVTGRPSGFEGITLPPPIDAQIELGRKPDTRAEKMLLGGMLGGLIDGKSGAALGAGLGFMAGLPEVKVGVESISAKLYHIAPLVHEQVADFITRWYNLRPEWQGKRDTGIQSFLGGVSDNQRSYLRELARRPIFLTLMALVHCTRNDMPHGRVELYKAIIDNYLVRQDRHRQIRESVKGKPMPHWPDLEKRLVLGYLAWESQKKRIGTKPSWEEHESAVVWSREELAEMVRGQLAGTSYGRFSGLKPEDADDLIDYFLHPAGLLVEPVAGQIQFAHLSFQEYLCADFLQGRLRGSQFNEVFEKDVLSHLSEPGWNEVAIQVVTIHAEKTHNEGQFDLIQLLDIKQKKRCSATN